MNLELALKALHQSGSYADQSQTGNCMHISDAVRFTSLHIHEGGNT